MSCAMPLYIRVFFSGNNNYIFLWKQLYYLSVSIKSSNLVARLIEIWRKNEVMVAAGYVNKTIFDAARTVIFALWFALDEQVYTVLRY